MSEAKRIVVVTSCTGVKANVAADQLIPAERLYVGEQHRRLMLGVDAFRSCEEQRPTGTKLEVWIVSAEHGLISGKKMLSPYDTSFSGMSKAELSKHAQGLGIPAGARRLLAGRYELAVVLLGDAYLHACRLDSGIVLGGPTLAFCGKGAAGRLSSLPELHTVVLTNNEAKRFSCGLVGLKGDVGGRLLSRLAEEPHRTRQVARPSFDVLTWLEVPTARDVALPLAA
jgi:hypothetical protein